jgi:hypothetical protein
MAGLIYVNKEEFEKLQDDSRKLAHLTVISLSQSKNLAQALKEKNDWQARAENLHSGAYDLGVNDGKATVISEVTYWKGRAEYAEKKLADIPPAPKPLLPKYHIGQVVRLIGGDGTSHGYHKIKAWHPYTGSCPGTKIVYDFEPIPRVKVNYDGTGEEYCYALSENEVV